MPPPPEEAVFPRKVQLRKRIGEDSAKTPPPVPPSARFDSKRQSRAMLSSLCTSDIPPPVPLWLSRNVVFTSVILDSLPVNPLPWLPEISHSPIWIEPHFQ